MIISRFGSTWSTAYQFSTYRGANEWTTERPPVVQPVGGVGGAFDFFSSENYPPAPLGITVRHALQSSTYAGVETLLDELRENTISANRSKLWGHTRQGTSYVYRRYIDAKCIALTQSEISGDQHLYMPVELVFYGPEGLWYEPDVDIITRYSTGSYTITNDGNYPALLDVYIYVSAGTMIYARIKNTTTNKQWEFNGNVTNLLSVESTSYTCIVDGSDAYSGLTPGSGQVAWMWLDPGDNDIQVTASGGTFGSVTFQFQDTWIM